MRRFRVAESNYPYFVTSSVVRWLPVFVMPSTCDIIINSLSYCRDAKGLRIHAYVIMPTHIHLILSSEADLSAILRDFKRYTAGQIVKIFEDTRNPPFHNVFRFCGRDNRPPTDHKVWQDGSHPEQIRAEEFFLQKVEYMHANPFRKNLVLDPLAWKYSSAGSFAGVGDGPLDLDWIEW